MRLSVRVGIAQALEVSLDDLLIPAQRAARREYPSLFADLAVVVASLHSLSQEEQSQVAAILSAYLATRLH